MDMYSSLQVEHSVWRAFPELSRESVHEIVATYAHACYASRSASLQAVDILRIKWMIGVSLAHTHDMALDAVAQVVSDAIA